MGAAPGTLFRATLTNVNRFSNAAGRVTFGCMAKLPGVGNVVLGCSTPGYYPQVGDDCECVWRDSVTGWVMWPVGGQLPMRVELQRIAAWNTAAAAFSGIPFDTQVDGPMSIGQNTGVVATAGVLIPFPGRWTVGGRFSISTTTIADRALAAVLQNGNEIKRGGDMIASAAVQVLGVDVDIPSMRCAAGDLLQIAAFTTAARVANPGADSCWMIVDFVGP
jgi:hypothetical protein